MLDKIRDAIKKYNLIRENDGILIGLSGGADSVCLTHILACLKDEFNLTVYTAHVNHGLRGEEADRDEKFAAEFSKSLGIECITEHENVKEYAKKQGISEELAGRKLRYAFFENTIKKYELNKIATAHNKNDNAETIVMNFIRGSVVQGLCGIPVKRGNIIRPLLDATREEIEEYCRKNSLSYVTDKTNNEMIYTRNKIRIDLIPKIQSEFNGNFIENVTKNAELIAVENDFLEKAAEDIFDNYKDGYIPLKYLDAHMAVTRRVIIKMIKSAGITDITSEYIGAVFSLLDNQSGKSVNLPKGNIAKIEYGKLYIGKASEKTPPFEYKIKIGEKTYIKELDITVSAETGSGKDAFKIGGNSEIIIRSRRDGDYFYPSGMEGRKKLKEYFIDNKIPRDIRDKTGILTIDGEIAWIIGRRRDRRFDADEGLIINILK